MATEQEPFEAISRTNIGILGLDILTIRGSDAVTTAVQSGDLARLTEVYDSLSTLPWLFRWFFPLSRLFSKDHGWFLPFRAANEPSYPPCAAFLRQKFTPRTADITGPVLRAADLLENTENPPDDEELSATLIDAIFLRFTAGDPRTPERVIEASGKQVFNIADAFLPHKFLPAKGAVHDVYAHSEASLRASSVYTDLPPEIATDAAHAIFTPRVHGANMLRGLASSLDDDAEPTLARLALTESVMRVVGRTGTLGGLLKEDEPAVRGRTIVVLDIRVAARQTGRLAWVFGKGDEERRCIAEPAILEFYEAVRAELRRRRDARTSSQ